MGLLDSKAILNGAIGRVVGYVIGAFFIAVCSAFGFGPPRWAAFIVSGLPFITPLAAQIVFVMLALTTFALLVLVFLRHRPSEPKPSEAEMERRHRFMEAVYQVGEPPLPVPEGPVQVSGWKHPGEALEEFTDPEVREARDKALDDYFRREQSTRALEDKIRAWDEQYSDGKTANDEQRDHRRRMRTALELGALSWDVSKTEAREGWNMLRLNLVRKLSHGILIAKGFRFPHVAGNREVEIPASEWRILDLDDAKASATRSGSDEIVYFGIEMRHTHEPPPRSEIVKRLWELRKKGVELRNSPPRSFDGGRWLEKYNKWRKDVLQQAQLLSLSFREHLETLNEMGPIPSNVPKTDSLSMHYVQIASEIIRRMEDYLKREMDEKEH